MVLGWAATGYYATQVNQYHASRLCISGGSGDCRQYLRTRIADEYRRHTCYYEADESGSYCANRVIIVVSPDLCYVCVIQFNSGTIPHPEFAKGRRVTVEYWKHTAVTVKGQFGTVLKTTQHPEEMEKAVRLVAIGFSGVALLFLTIAVVRWRRKMRRLA